MMRWLCQLGILFLFLVSLIGCESDPVGLPDATLLDQLATVRVSREHGSEFLRKIPATVLAKAQSKSKGRKKRKRNPEGGERIIQERASEPQVG